METWRFTNSGSTGSQGPTQNDVNLEYENTNLDGEVSIVTRGFQEWEVPKEGLYYIEAIGASGGIATKAGARGGYPALVSSSFLLSAKDHITIVVGQVGQDGTENGGGGGGVFRL